MGDDRYQKNRRIVEDIVGQMTYMPGWYFSVVHRGGYTAHLRIFIETTDSRLPNAHTAPRIEREQPFEYYETDFGTRQMRSALSYGNAMEVGHLFEIGWALPWSRENWERWVLDCILQVHKHEAMEFFKINGKAPYFPDHSPGGDVYKIQRVEERV